MARIDLQENDAARPDELARCINLRHTNRKLYSGPSLTCGERVALSGDVARVNGVHLVWLKGVQRRRALGLVWLAESERFLRRDLHEELFSSIRFDLDWESTADRAIPPGALEVEPVMRPLFKALRQWSRMQMLNRVGLHRILGLRAGWFPCWQAPALGLIATGLPLQEGAFAVGRGFERLWLRATALGLALQPMAASTVLPFQNGLANGASDRVRAILRAGWQEVVPGLTPLMLFRMGRAEPASVRAGRQQASQHILFK